MIRLLVVDPRLQLRLRLCELLADASDCAVVGEARSLAEAAVLCERLHPDVALCAAALLADPGADGAALTSRLPVIVLEQGGAAGQSAGARALGAWGGLPHPGEGGDGGAAPLLAAIREAAATLPVRVSEGAGGRHILAIGASTGGPQAVMQVLQGIPPGLGLSILIVQHMARSFVDNFAAWLDRDSPVAVRLARGGERLAPDLALVAPGDRHLRVRGGRVELSAAPPVHSCRPAVDVLFESLAEEHAAETVAVLLTGIGRDGARGMAALHRRGGYTIAQDEASSVVFGMPRAAIRLRAVDEILPLSAIPAALLRVFDIGREM